MSDCYYDRTERELEEMLLTLAPEELPRFLAEQAGKMYPEKRPFAAFMRAKLKEKGIPQQDVFLAADLPERYGYKLISEEKHTVRRDTVLRLCFAAGFRPEEVREALILYGMAPLCARFPRDAVLLVAFRCRIRDIHDVDALLRENGLPPLLAEE